MCGVKIKNYFLILMTLITLISQKNKASKPTGLQAIILQYCQHFFTILSTLHDTVNACFGLVKVSLRSVMVSNINAIMK